MFVEGEVKNALLYTYYLCMCMYAKENWNPRHQNFNSDFLIGRFVEGFSVLHLCM